MGAMGFRAIHLRYAWRRVVRRGTVAGDWRGPLLQRSIAPGSGHAAGGLQRIDVVRTIPGPAPRPGSLP
jgi:hypothetical protein